MELFSQLQQFQSAKSRQQPQVFKYKTWMLLLKLSELLIKLVVSSVIFLREAHPSTTSLTLAHLAVLPLKLSELLIKLVASLAISQHVDLPSTISSIATTVTWPWWWWWTTIWTCSILTWECLTAVWICSTPVALSSNSCNWIKIRKQSQQSLNNKPRPGNRKNPKEKPTIKPIKDQELELSLFDELNQELFEFLKLISIEYLNKI